MPDRLTIERPPRSPGNEFERLAEKHRKCEERLSGLRDRLFLSAQEKLEEITIKKQKLLLKDRMEALVRLGEGAEILRSG